MPRCFVTGCKSGYDSQRSAEKRHFFRAPRDSSRLQVWQRAIPRLDKQLTSSCVVCDLHFEDSDLVKEFVHNINGDVIIPHDNWALKDDAVARLFTNCPSYLSSGLKLFASQMTTEAMRVTLLSTLDIIEYLFGQGAHYILTAKLNQDPLERHFGLVRSFGGDESHPTVVNFTQIFRLLSLCTPIKTALRGSVEGAPSAVLVGVQDTLRRTKEDGSLNKAKLRDLIEARMRDLTTGPGDSHQHEDSDHVDFKGEVDDSILYYLSGYVVHKFTKTTTCSSCIGDISSTEPVVGKYAYLTIYRSFKEGCLKHPSRKMLHFVKIVNRAVSHFLSGDQVTSDFFWDVLDELEMENIDRLGCVEHEVAFTCQVLNFIIVTRMHFYARDVNRRLENIEKAAVANKKARLL
ncbi:hypothetical protein HPB49_023146 [Dermacentor silvarum]|uniref:Uncharacterized protein n=1 Tax=Dermacentor silvarum TaxID=543639 RepID=A0ACB8CTM9_DERSI|nr:hypothetical protein HPB49_023146 [Dermacentor silvarum]